MKTEIDTFVEDSYSEFLTIELRDRIDDMVEDQRVKGLAEILRVDEDSVRSLIKEKKLTFGVVDGIVCWQLYSNLIARE